VVAVDASSGKTKWYYQTVPHDIWDLDAVSPSGDCDGRRERRSSCHAGKTAWVYILDAATGKLIKRSDNFTPQESMFALPTPEGTRMLPARTADGVVADLNQSGRSTTPTWRVAPADELQDPHRAVREGASMAGLGLRGDPRGAQYGLFSAVDLSTGKTPGRTRWISR